MIKCLEKNQDRYKCKAEIEEIGERIYDLEERDEIDDIYKSVKDPLKRLNEMFKGKF